MPKYGQSERGRTVQSVGFAVLDQQPATSTSAHALCAIQGFVSRGRWLKESVSGDAKLMCNMSTRKNREGSGLYKTRLYSKMFSSFIGC